MNKKALFTFKPVDYMTNPHMYAGLVKLDLDSGVIENILKIPAATFKTNNAFMANFVQGLCADEKYIYISGWNFIMIVDPSDFTVVDSFSSSEMADVHSLSVDEKNLYVISTATECLLCFDKKSFKKKWVWGPNEKILSYESFGFLPPLKNQIYRKFIRKFGIRKYVITPEYKKEDTRHVHKTSSSYYRHHMNNVLVTEENIYINTKGWFNSTSSSVIKISKDSLATSFFLKPGTFIGSHDGCFHNNRYYATEADNNSVVSVDLNGEDIKRHTLKPEGFFVRGMILTEDVHYIGFSPLRGSNDSAIIIGYSPDYLQKIIEIKIPELCGRNQKVAIHTIIKV